MDGDECFHQKNIVTDSRPAASAQGWAAVKRRRACVDCGVRWTTIEIPLIEYEDLLLTAAPTKD